MDPEQLSYRYKLFHKYKQALIRAWVMDANDDHNNKIRTITREAHERADELEREFWQLLEKESKKDIT